MFDFNSPKIQRDMSVSGSAEGSDELSRNMLNVNGL